MEEHQSYLGVEARIERKGQLMLLTAEGLATEIVDLQKKRDIATMAKIICRHVQAVGPKCHCNGDASACSAIVRYSRAAAELQAALVKTGRLTYNND